MVPQSIPTLIPMEQEPGSHWTAPERTVVQSHPATASPVPSVEGYRVSDSEKSASIRLGPTVDHDPLAATDELDPALPLTIDSSQPSAAPALAPSSVLAQTPDRSSSPYLTPDGASVRSQDESASKRFGKGNIITYNDSIAETGPKFIRSRIDKALNTWCVSLAVYDAELSSGCMDGTRIEVLAAIDTWLKDPNAPSIFWLAGMAGTGKTAIAWTVCMRASDNPKIILGGSFFCSCSASTPERRDVRRVIPTLARLFARQSEQFSEALADELARDPDIMSKQIKAQVKQLLYKPLLALKDLRSPVLFVIDALDECSGQTSVDGKSDDAESLRVVSDLLDALVTEFSRSGANLPVKFLITSRPETHIRDSPVSDAEKTRILQLHNVDKAQVAADVHLYIHTRLLGSPQLRAQFTSEDAVALSRVCDGLFIVAATALNYTLAVSMDAAAERFQTLLNASRDSMSIGVAESLDAMYALILADATRRDGSEGANKIPTLPELLASLLSTRMTLSVAALVDLLDQSTSDSARVSSARTRLRARLSRLHAVVHVPDGDDELGLRVLHASFGDYLFTRAPSATRLSESLGHDILARACFNVMNKRLGLNISQSMTSFESNPPARPDGITLSLEYACLQWAYHIAAAPNPSMLYQDIERKFRPRLLFWLEVMSVLGHVRRAAAMLAFAATTIQSTELSRFFHEANSFVASSREAIERSAPHIYLSALPFAARDSLIYKTFIPLCNGLISVELCGTDGHSGSIMMTLTGHDDSVNAVACASDGHWPGVVSGSDDGTVRIWDTRVGEETMAPLRNQNVTFKSVAFAPTGTSVAAGTAGGEVCLWNILDNQATLRRLSGHSAASSCVEFSSDGSLLASASWDRTVRLWNVQSGECFGVLHGHVGRVHVVTFSSGSDLLATGADDSTIRLWRRARGKSEAPFKLDAPFKPDAPFLHGHTSWILSVAFSRDSTILASGGRDRDIRLWDVKSRTNIVTLSGHSDCVRSVQFSANGRSLVSASDDKNIRLWTLQDDPSQASSVILDGHTDSVHCVAFSPDDQCIVSASADHTIQIWDAGRDRPPVRPLPAHSDTVMAVAAHPDGLTVISGSTDSSVRVWNASTGEPKFDPLHRHTDEVYSATISLNGRLIASASKDHTIRLWNAETGELIGEPLREHYDDVNAVAFSPGSEWLASGSDDKTVRIWSTATQTPAALGPFDCSNSILAVQFSPNGELLAAGDRGGCVHLWRMETGQQEWEPLEAHGDMIHSISFSPESTHIASGGRDNVVYVWDISQRKQVTCLKGHTGWVLSVAYSHNGQFIGTGSADNTVQLWDSSTGTTIAKLHGHQSWVQSVAFMPDGRSIISGSRDTTIRVWDVSATPSSSEATSTNVLTALVSTPLKDGWLLGPKGELLIWVPSDYRSYLQVQPCKMVIGKHRIVLKDENRTLHAGEMWTACWRA